MTFQEKLEVFRAKVQEETYQRMVKFSADYLPPERVMEVHGKSAIETRVIPGKKYTKVDVGTSGKFMIDSYGNILGIKGYGVIHRGHQYGTLDTINEWFWGEYHPVRIAA
jgi:hypothetical protein